MSSELQVPFGLSPNGAIALTTDPDVQTGQHVNSLISTRPGERVMAPTYGVDLAGQVFGNPSAAANEITNDVITAIQQWEPSVTVKSVGLAPGQDLSTGLVQVEVDYVTPASGVTNPAAVSTATVLVGGTVIDQVSP